MQCNKPSGTEFFFPDSLFLCLAMVAWNFMFLMVESCLASFGWGVPYLSR